MIYRQEIWIRREKQILRHALILFIINFALPNNITMQYLKQSPSYEHPKWDIKFDLMSTLFSISTEITNLDNRFLEALKGRVPTGGGQGGRHRPHRRSAPEHRGSVLLQADAITAVKQTSHGTYIVWATTTMYMSVVI